MTFDAAALLIIDMQKCMASPHHVRNNPAAEDNIAALLAAWRLKGRPVIHIRHISRNTASGFRPGQSSAEFQSRFEPEPDEHVVEKNVPDAFAQSGLERWLRVRAINALVICGVATNNSVESTARSAGNLGFTTVIAADAAFAFEKVDFDGRLRSAQEVHAMSLANLHGEYGAVLDTAAILSDGDPR